MNKCIVAFFLYLLSNTLKSQTPLAIEFANFEVYDADSVKANFSITTSSTNIEVKYAKCWYDGDSNMNGENPTETGDALNSGSKLTIEKGTFVLVDNKTHSPVFNNSIQDLIFYFDGMKTGFYSSQSGISSIKYSKNKHFIYFENNCDSIYTVTKTEIALKSAKKNYFKITNPIVYILSNNKWYVHNLLLNTTYNNTNGFDSLLVLDDNNYVAYFDKQFNKFSWKYPSNFNQKYDYMFPSIYSNYHLVAKNAAFDLKSKQMVNEISSIDEYGNEIKTQKNEVVTLPIFTKGKFNLRDYHSNNELLNNWVDEIKFPTINSKEFSLFDSTSFIYQNNVSIEETMGLIFEEINNGIAIRDGEKWTIMPLNNQANNKCCFDQVSFKNGIWRAKKGKLVALYKLTLTDIEFLGNE